MKNLVLLALILTSFSYSQKLKFNTNIESNAYLSNESDLPFWFYTNNFGRLDSSSNFNTLLGQGLTYSINENANIKGYGSLLYQNGFTDKVQIDQAYVQFTNTWLKATAGAFHQNIAYDNLSTTNGNFLWSGNTRAIPGIVLESNEPVKVFNNLGIDWSIGHYELIDDRFVDGANIHFKSLGIDWRITETAKIKAGIRHYAQWAGTSREFGKAPQSFDDFIDIFFASRAGDDAIPGEQQNALGNHLGSYYLNYFKTFSTFDLEFYYQHPFEDGSGTAFKNAKDGIWGVFISPKNSFFKSFLYEFISTKDQNGFGGVSGNDNYFRNGYYRNGYTYERRTIGLPLLTPLDFEGLGPVSRITSHQLGLSYQRHKFSGLIKASHIKRFGTYPQPYDPTEKSAYIYQEFNYELFFGTITFYSGADFTTSKSPQFGVGLGYTYSFNY